MPPLIRVPFAIQRCSFPGCENPIRYEILPCHYPGRNWVCSVEHGSAAYRLPRDVRERMVKDLSIQAVARRPHAAAD